MNVFLGEAKLSSRIVARRLPKEALEQRLKNITEKNRKSGKKNQSKPSIFEQWTIFVTNLPESVSALKLTNLYRLRWQIELFFKVLKSFFNLRIIKDSNPYKATCSIYISLIAATLLTQYALSISDDEISLYKAARVFTKNIKKFIQTVVLDLSFTWLIQKIKLYSIKEKTPKRPSNKDLLGIIYA